MEMHRIGRDRCRYKGIDNGRGRSGDIDIYIYIYRERRRHIRGAGGGRETSRDITLKAKHVEAKVIITHHQHI